MNPTNCPICHSCKVFTNTAVHIAGGTIFKCNECCGYFLFPPQIVEYIDSGWTKRRETEWERNVQLATEIAPKILKFVETYLGRPVKNILEVGCGSGYMGVGFMAAGRDYVGTDIDAESIDWAIKHGINAYCVAMEDLPPPQTVGVACASPLNQKYDLIVSSNVFEHLNDPSKSFSNLRSILGGILIIIVPNAHGLFPRIKANKVISRIVKWINRTNREIAYSIDGYWHNIGYTKETLAYLSSRTGIEVIAIEPMSINDPIFGFVQPNNSLSFRLASSLAALLKMDSEILLIGRRKAANGS